VVIDSEVVARKRAVWQGRANVERFVEQTEAAHAPQRLKDVVETGIVRRFMCGENILDVGIGTGRVSLALLEPGLRLTGVDASAAMIERCADDPRSAATRLVQGELEQLPFSAQAFDTVISIDTFGHFPDWQTNLDEMLRVTRSGGRLIVDVGSLEHVIAVANRCGRTIEEIRGAELDDAGAYALRLSPAELRTYARQRAISLIALVPSGAVFGSLVPNYWISPSFAWRGGGIDRLVSWLGADPLLFAFAEFIERRIVQVLPPLVGSRMFAVFERQRQAAPQRKPLVAQLANGDERGPAAWHAEFAAHAEHAPNRAFAVALLLAARPERLPQALRAELPEPLRHDLERAERAAHIDDVCEAAADAWRASPTELAFHGVNLANVFARPLERELRERSEAAE
jgi:SAM-dependent methyltransferase